ncbi:TPA: hypothetical protein ACINVR_001832 [Streptococcus agalactiae]
MHRGTTPTNIFRTDVDLTNASVLFSMTGMPSICGESPQGA